LVSVTKYNKYNIGLTKNGLADNFVSFKARKSYLIMRLKLEDIQNELLESGLDLNTVLMKMDKEYHFRLVLAG
jgi:hypothetical protein